MFPSNKLSWFMVGIGALSVAVFMLAARDSVVQITAFFAPLVAATVALLWRVSSQGVRTTGWLWLLASGAITYALVTTVWYLGPVLFGLTLPFPSVVDVIYFAVYIAYAFFLLGVLGRQPAERSSDARTSVIDSLLLTNALCAVIWVAWVEPALRGGDSSLLVVGATLGYPALTLLMFGVAARLALTLAGRSGVVGVLLLVWIAGEIIGDVQYGIVGATGQFTYGDAASVPWIVSYTALAALAVHPRLTELMGAPGAVTGVVVDAAQHGTSHRVAQVLVPLAAIMVPVALTWADTAHTKFLLTVATLSIGLVGLRLALTAGDLRNERSLRAELDGAMLRQERQAGQLEELAYQDTVTGLANRTLLYREAHRQHIDLRSAALLLLDLDGFKQVNDTLGHSSGDALLRQVGRRLGECVRSGDTVARLGGDEFAILLPDTQVATALQIANRMVDQVRAPYKLDGGAVRVQGSIGIACDSSATTLDDLLREADLAMYEAKAAGRDRAVVFDPRLLAQVTSRVRAETELTEAVNEGQFTVYYQPIIAAESGRVASVEALVRWDHPVRGVLPPSDFLATAQHTGLIVPIGEMVLRAACAQTARWRREVAPDLSLAANVSEKELLHPDYARTVSEILESTGLPPTALCLEVTETVLAGAEDISRTLQPLADLGVHFSIDDFGTGHSSLSRLRQLTAVRQLKIDRSFVAEIDEGARATAPLLTSIIVLAHSIGKLVVAEGVETEHQADFLVANGCDELQGYFFSRPVAAPHLTDILQARRSTSHQRSPTPATALPSMMQDLLASTAPLDELIPRLLREIADVSGYECSFYTEIDDPETRQVVVHAYNTASENLAISSGVTVPWSDALCRRLIDDGLDSVADADHRYPDSDVATNAGIRAYLSLPIHDTDGRLHGTLCAADTRPGGAPPQTVELMRLFAAALSTRLTGTAEPGRLGAPSPQAV